MSEYISINDTPYWKHLKVKLKNQPTAEDLFTEIFFVGHPAVTETILRKLRNKAGVTVKTTIARPSGIQRAEVSVVDAKHPLVLYFINTKEVKTCWEHPAIPGHTSGRHYVVWLVGVKSYIAEQIKEDWADRAHVYDCGEIITGCIFCETIIRGNPMYMRRPKDKDSQRVELQYCPVCGRYLPSRREYQDRLNKAQAILASADWED